MTQPEGAGTGPANPNGDGGVTATLFTQEQVNHFNANAKRGAVETFFKEQVGLDKPLSADELKNTLAAAAEYNKLQNGQKSDVERLTTENATLKTAADEVPTLKTQLLRAKLAGDAGLKSRYWKYVEGDDEEAIKASIAETLQDIRGGGDGSGDEGEPGEPNPEQAPPARKGTGSLAPNPQQGSGGSAKPKVSMSAGREAYESKRGKKKE